MQSSATDTPHQKRVTGKYMLFAANELLQKRTAAKLSSEKLAELSGVPEQTIIGIESGLSKSTSVDVLNKLAKVLKCDVRHLLSPLGEIQENAKLQAETQAFIMKERRKIAKAQAEMQLDILDCTQVAQIMDVNIKVVRESASTGKIPCRKVGRSYRFSRKAVLEWLQGTEDRVALKR